MTALGVAFGQPDAAARAAYWFAVLHGQRRELESALADVRAQRALLAESGLGAGDEWRGVASAIFSGALAVVVHDLVAVELSLQRAIAETSTAAREVAAGV